MSFFITLLIYAVLFVLSDLLSPKPELENAKPDGIGDFRFPTATEQRPVPLLWGTVRISGPNVVWWGDLEQAPITEKVKTGLFSSETITKGYRYLIGTQQALCEGEIDDLIRVWIDEDLVVDETAGTPIVDGGDFTIDEPELFGGDDLGSGGFTGTFRLHAGSSTQAVSTYLSQFQKEPPTTGDTPAYRGYCFIANSSARAYVGNSSSIKPMKWEVRRTPNQLAMTSGKERVNTWDANPMCVLYEAMTNTDWGKGIDTAEIDAPNFRTAGDTLHTEGNGFSMIVDREEDIGDLIRRVEQQIDGVVYQNPFTGLWQVKLARDDYVIGDVFALTVDNVMDVVSYTQSTWEDTKNQVSVPFNQRDDDYKGTYGFAQDMANQRIVGKKTPTTMAHPGVKDTTLANSLAWRAMRTLSQPLIAMTVIVDRTAYGQLPGNVVSFTDPDYNANLIPMRIQAIDYGSLLDGKIRIRLVQDVFRAAAGSFGDPPGSGWDPPSDVLVAFPSDEQLAIEAPRALTLRDPGSSVPDTDKVWTSGRRQGPEAMFRVRTRNAAGVPAGAFEVTGEVYGFMLIGELAAALSENSAYPHTTLTLNSTPSTQGDLVNAFPSVVDVVELGTELLSLLYVDGEFMLVTSAAAGGGSQVTLSNVYRGVCDSAQKAHAINTSVFLVFVGAGMTDTSFPAGDNVDVKLTPRSVSDEVTEAAATTIAVALDNRTRRPYPPSEFTINGTRLDLLLVNMAGGGGAGETAYFTIAAINRRDFRATDEILQLTTDAGTLFADYPTANTTTHRLIVSDGSTELVNQDIGTAVTGNVLRLDVLQALNDTSLPASLTFGVRARHLFDAVSYDSMVDCEVTSTLTDTLIGLWALGARLANVASTQYVVAVGDDTTDHVFNLTTSFTVGNVQYRINGGSWVTMITAGGTGPGTVPNASLTAGDTIEIQHTSTDSGAQKLATMTVGGTPKAYGVLHTP